MSLMRLLAVGRSLGRLTDEPHRYKMARRGLLPKFGPAPQAPAVVGSNALGPSENGGRASERGRLSPADARVNDDQKMNNVDAQKESPDQTAPVSSAPRHRFPHGRWTLFRRNPFDPSPKPEPSTRPVQGELSLDLVKPVRNDLTDSDVEVVSGGRRDQPTTPPVASEPAVRVAAEEDTAAETAQPVWRRLKTQFFGASAD